MAQARSRRPKILVGAGNFVAAVNDAQRTVGATRAVDLAGLDGEFGRLRPGTACLNDA